MNADILLVNMAAEILLEVLSVYVTVGMNLIVMDVHALVSLFTCVFIIVPLTIFPITISIRMVCVYHHPVNCMYLCMYNTSMFYVMNK